MRVVSALLAAALCALAAHHVSAAAPSAGPATPPAAPAAAPAPAAAKPGEDVWFVAKTAGGAVSYHASGLKHDRNLGTVAMTSALYFATPATSPGGKPFQILLAQDNFDCIGRQIQPIARLMMTADVKPVEALDEEKPTWKAAGADPTLNLLYGVACSAKALAGAKKANAFPAAVKMMREMK